MWKQKLGMSAGGGFGVPAAEFVRLVHVAGFDAVSPEQCADLPAMIDAARECGLSLQSLHAPFGKAAAMWNPDPAVSVPAAEELIASLTDCARYEIPVMVAHVWIGFDYTFDPDHLHFTQFDSVVREAERLGVQIAFENTEGEEYLFALMDHYKNCAAVGFCWDAGHEMCYNHSKDLLAMYGDRLLVTHLNDNLGVSRYDGRTFWTDDLHLLPYDGIGDWEYNANRLRASRPLEYLNFELTIRSKPNRHENDGYAAMPLPVYLAEAYKRACRIAMRYAR